MRAVCLIVAIAIVPSLDAQCIGAVKAVASGSHAYHFEGIADTLGTNTRAALHIAESVAALETNRMREWNISSATDADRVLNPANLKGGTTYYFDFRASDASGVYGTDYTDCQASLCQDGEGVQTSGGASGYSCTDADGAGPGTDLIPYIVTAADAGFIPPQDPVHARTKGEVLTPPTVNGSTIDVATHACGSETCATDFQAALNDVGDAGTKDTDLVHEIVVPAGTVLVPEEDESGPLGYWTLPQKTGTGVVIIRCGADSDHAIPAGVQFTPGLRNAQTCTIRTNKSYIANGGPYSAGGALWKAGCSSDDCSNGWRWEGFVVEPAPWREVSTSNTVAVSSVGSADLTLSSSYVGKMATYMSLVYALPGLTGNQDDRPYHALGDSLPNFIATTTLRPSVATSWTGSYGGGGTVTAAPPAYEIVSATAAVDPVITLEADHHQIDYPDVAIGSIASGQITLSGADHTAFSVNASVYLSGNSGCADGHYTVESVTAPDKVKLYGATCDGSGGTLTRFHLGYFDELTGTGAAALRGVHRVSYPGPNTVKVWRVDLAGLTITDGGFAVQQAPRIQAIFNFQNSSNWTIDRCLFRGGSRLWRIIGLISPGACAGCADFESDGAVVNSYFQRIRAWSPLDDMEGVHDQTQTDNAFGMIPQLISANRLEDFQMHNVTDENSHGFVMFENNCTSCVSSPQDIELSNVKVRQDSEFVMNLGARAIANVGWNQRHRYEFKALQRFKATGLYVQGSIVAAVSDARFFFGSYWTNTPATATGRRMEDIALAQLWTEDIAAGIGLSFNIGSGPRTLGAPSSYPIRRFSVDNWIINGMPWPAKIGSAWGDALTNKGSAISPNGSMIRISGPLHDFRATRVTCRRCQNSSFDSPLFNGSSDRASSIQLEDWLVTWSGDSNEGLTVRDQSDMLPSGGGGVLGGLSAFLGWTQRPGGDSDPNSYFGLTGAEIGVIPCQADQQALTPDYASANNQRSTADAAFAGTNDAWKPILIGADSESCIDREAAGFGADLSAKPGSAVEGLGAAPAEIQAALGYKTVVVSVSGATISYTVPSGLSSTACTIDYSPDAWATWTRTTTTSRSVAVSGSPGETIYYRVLCPGNATTPTPEQAWGSLRL